MADSSSGHNHHDELRREIQRISADKSLSPTERARTIQALMARRWNEKQSNPNSELAGEIDPLVVSDEDRRPTYHLGMDLGCKHYSRGCKLRADCCKRVFGCRHCHNETVKDHEIDRYATKLMICMHCGVQQAIAGTCANSDCGEKLARYYCDVCKFHDDAPNKEIYHCDKCRMCRIGKGLGIDFFHCDVCAVCMPVEKENNHKCMPNVMSGGCPICFEDLFSSTRAVYFLPCGHSIHRDCLAAYTTGGNYRCPMCSKSIGKMDRLFNAMENMVLTQPMPEEYRESESEILCNDCEKTSWTQYHWVAHQCKHCRSFNTRVLSTRNLPDQSRATTNATAGPTT